MCSTIGIPARSSIEWAGRCRIVGGVDVQRVDADQRDARGDQQLHGIEGEERLVVDVAPVRQNRSKPVWTSTARPPSRAVGDASARCRGRAAPRDVDPDRGQVDQALERQPGEVEPSS